MNADGATETALLCYSWIPAPRLRVDNLRGND
jgi:hypothetical protein